MNKNNLELKHYCSDFKPIRKILSQLGAKKITVKKQKDFFFNLPEIQTKQSGRFKWRIEADKQTMVYYERPEFVKGKQAVSDLKLYVVKDGRLFDFLKQVLGIRAVVDKKREIWRKDNTVFHLDTVKGVGMVFEIELQKNGKFLPKDFEIFKNYQNTLMPFLDQVIKGSNVDLVLNK